MAERDVGAIEIDCVDAGLFDGFLFLAELARMKHPDLMAAGAALRDQAAHVTHRLDGRIIFARNSRVHALLGMTAVKSSPPANIAVRQTQARLYTGNLVPL